MSKFYALTSNEELIEIEAETAGDALELEPDNTVWLFSGATLGHLGDAIETALDSHTLFAAVLKEPREDDRTFIVAARNEPHVREIVLDHSVRDACSIAIVPLEAVLAEHDGCLEVLE